MNFRARYSLLTGLFWHYFHVDWTDDHESEDDVIQAYVDDVGSDNAYATVKELDEFISLGLPEPELRKAIVDDFGSGYYRGYTLKTVEEVYDWLKSIRNTMAKYAAEKTEREKAHAAE